MKITSNQKIMTILTMLGLSFTTGCVTEQAKDPIALVLTKRHSGYAYDPARIVTQDQLQAIIKAGQLAPSSYNDQPWYFIVCDRTTNPQAYDKVFNALIEFNQEWVKNVPVLIVAIAATNSGRNNTFNRWAQYDTGAAAFGMMLQATSLGLMAHQMGGFDEAKISQSFGIPSDFVPMAVMAIGYPAATEPQSVAKTRKPLNENFFMGTWDLN